MNDCLSGCVQPERMLPSDLWIINSHERRDNPVRFRGAVPCLHLDVEDRPGL